LRRIEFTRSGARDLERLTVVERNDIFAALESLAAGRRADIKKLAAYDPPRWRLRVGRLRVIFALPLERVVIERIGDRRDVYR
jgi:mRNA-degrading endonuclease RelE of RelBE toxin-antitoxin system